jgi:hypothetical protein
MAVRACLLVLLLLSVFLFLCADSKYIVYNTTSSIVPGKLNVHLVAHSHDDVGWLKTIDQYYVGSNNSIQVRTFLCLSSSISLLLFSIEKNTKMTMLQTDATMNVTDAESIT